MWRIVAVVALGICSAVAQTSSVSLSDDPHFQLFLENEYARVFSLVLRPHEATLLHRHSSDYVRIAVGDAKMRFSSPGIADTTRTTNDGFTQFIPAGTRHSITNDDAFSTLRAIVVEVKKSGIRPGNAYDDWTARAIAYDSIALAVDPNASFKNGHSTPTVDGLDIQLRPMDSTSIGPCQRNCLVVAITDLKLEKKTESGAIEMSMGDASWLSPTSEEQVLKNLSTGSARFILLRFK